MPDGTENLEGVSARYGKGDASALVPFLQDMQRENGYLSEGAMRGAAHHLDVPLSRVYSVATFFKAFSLKPRGEVILKVCVGTTCHIRGAMVVIDDIYKELGVRPGDTTSDMKYTVETVGCVGACALSPVVLAGDDYLTGVRPGTIAKRLEKVRKRT